MPIGRVRSKGPVGKHPRGPDSTIIGLDDHPLVHVAYEDAEAYAKWAEKELPTEAEWEIATGGGLDGMDFTWGNRRYADFPNPGPIHGRANSLTRIY